MMSTQRKALLVLVASISTLGVLCCRFETIRDSVSPTGTYRVVLEGQDDRPEWGVAEVCLRAYKEQNLWVDEPAFYVADYYDPPFSQRYSVAVWDSNTVFRLTQAHPRDWPSDSLVVTNQTDRAIRLVDIYAGDRLLIFDFEPRETRRFAVPYNDVAAFVRCRGRFADGSEFDSGGTSFLHNGSVAPPLDLQVRILDGSVLVNCVQANGESSVLGHVPRAQSTNAS